MTLSCPQDLFGIQKVQPVTQTVPLKQLLCPPDLCEATSGTATF